MTDATTQFFEDLKQRGHVPMLATASGTVRCNVANGKKTEHWLVTIDKGDVSVSRSNRAAECTITGDRALFEAFATGEANPVAAILRGRVAVEGDWRLLVLFRRLLPGSSPSKLRQAVPVGRSRR